MKTWFLFFALFFSIAVQAQQTPAPPRPLTMDEYNKAKTYAVKDLDNDTYVKFDNNYVLDRYELRKPYFVTGDDGLKKRIDLYTLLYKGNTQPLGTLIYYTTEGGKRYTALQPNFAADEKVWAQYFEDIHAIDKEEKNFVLKLSYILSKEMSFQLHKAMNGGKVKAEDATYGSNICFPGDQLVLMGDGSTKPIQQVKTGDQIITTDAFTQRPVTTTVTALVAHNAQPHAITELLLLHADEQQTATGLEVNLKTKTLSATPNHPLPFNGLRKTIGDVNIGEKLLCLNESTGQYQTYTVMNSTEKKGRLQKVFNIETASGTTLLINHVMVLQK